MRIKLRNASCIFYEVKEVKEVQLSIDVGACCF